MRSCALSQWRLSLALLHRFPYSTRLFPVPGRSDGVSTSVRPADACLQELSADACTNAGMWQSSQSLFREARLQNLEPSSFRLGLPARSDEANGRWEQIVRVLNQ